MPSTADAPESATVNVAVLRGVCPNPPDVRVLESGRRLGSLALRTHGPGARATSVPVTVWDPPTWLETLAGGEELVVVGAVHRRFFRTPTGSAAKAEVEATYVARATPKRLATAWRRAEDALEGLA
ncbi:MAG TPA: single-stranded DNA-binding protein [Acidimicrobiia bacterium]|nr:single-stranded DNA-binding protein [Acidimicrobiia bacterium]